MQNPILPNARFEPLCDVMPVWLRARADMPVPPPAVYSSGICGGASGAEVMVRDAN